MFENISQYQENEWLFCFATLSFIIGQCSRYITTLEIPYHKCYRAKQIITEHLTEWTAFVCFNVILS